MAIALLTNIYYGKRSYTRGEIIKCLTKDEEKRLIKLKYAVPVPKSEKPTKSRNK